MQLRSLCGRGAFASVNELVDEDGTQRRGLALARLALRRNRETLRVAAISQAAGITATILTSAALAARAGLIVVRSRADRLDEPVAS